MEPRLLVLLAFVSMAIAGPITVQETNECATQCPPSTKLTYTPGTTYVYDYRVDYSTSMSGASEDSAKLTLTTTAELEVLGPCEMALSLRDTRLFHSDAMGGLKAADREEIFRRGLEGSALRFSYQDGVVEHVCEGNREEPWALNIKKGILSAFQNSMDDLSQPKNVTEIDVMGTCETQYEAVSSGYYSNSVKKTKDILTCTDRHDYKTILHMVPYNVPSELQSIPLMKTSHECDQVIQKGGVLQSTICTETHVWRPFSYDKSGGATSVKQTLTYKTYSRGVSSRQDIISSRDSLLFDHSASRPSANQARERVEQKLNEICESTSYDIRPESPRLFSELVYSLKSLDRQTMEEMFRQLKAKTLCPTNNKAYKMFLDALPMASSSASVSLMMSLIINEDVQGMHAKAWIASLALINAPTSEMLLDAKALVDSDKFREDALLPVSSMVNNFCFKSSACDQSYAVLSIMASLERNIGSRCDASGKDFHQILLRLRAIGNAGHASRAVSVINQCLTNSRNPLEIRVAAAIAFRRMPCDAESTELWNTYESSELDSELRIAAYQALMRCPSDATLAKMAASLGGELDEQVGAFVYSHMTNLKQTSDPHKQVVARALDNLVIPTKYESSPMKASSNMEASALINKINSGFVAESNLVWSNNAQVPRSASANLTVELFGQSINLLDFGGRVEGLEHLIKNLFGPYLGDEEAKKAKFVSLDKIHGSVYGRFFGNEMLFVHSKQVGSSFDKMSYKWLDILISLAQKQEAAFTHGGQFIDVSMIIPTAAGLPIHVDVNGSAVVDVLLNGKADLRKLSSSPRSLDIDGEIRPSAAMEITGAMSVNAFVTKAGLRMRNTMHTSTSLKGHIQLERGQQLSIELDTPKDKMEIFDARSKFFIVHNDVEQEQEMITENRKEFELCTCAKTAEITGAVLCGQISFPNASMQSEGPYFPLTGPSSASLVLRKTDTHSGYKLLAKRVQNKKMSVAQISFNTPGSSVNRMILIDLTMNFPRQSIDAQVVTPWKKAALAGALINKKDMKSLSGSLTIDESDIYAWTSEVKISKSKGIVRWSPMVEIRQPGMDTVQMNGFVSLVNGMKSLDMDLSLTGLQDLPYNLKVSASNTKKESSITASVSKDGGKSQYSVEASNRFSIAGKKAMIVSTSSMLKVNSPKREIVSIKTSAGYKEDKSLKLSGAFDVDKLMRKPAVFKLSFVKDAKKRGVRYDVDGNVRSTVFTGRVDSNTFIKSSGLLSTKTAVDYNIPKLAKNKIVLNGKFNDRSTRTYTKYILKSNLDVKKNPEYNVGLNFGFDHKKKNTEAELEVKYGANPKDKTKRLYFNTALNRKIPNYKNAVLVYKMKAQAPEHKINLQLTGKHTHNPKLIDSDVKLTYAKNKTVSASLLLKDKTGKATNVNGRASVAWPGSEYVLSSKLDRKSSKLTHEITLKGSNGLKHSIDTVYKKSNPKNHVFSTVLGLQGLKKTTLSGSANLHSKNMHVSGEVKYGKDTYGISSKAKQSKLPGGTLVVEAFYPDRRIVMKLDGEKAKNKLEGNVETSWDADKDKSKRITLGGSVYKKSSKNSVSLGGDMSFTSPFDNFEKLASTFKYGSDSSQHDITGKFSWGGKSKQVMSSLTLKRPISLSHFVASFEAKSPFKKMRSASAEIAHTWENALSSVLKGSLNKENAKLVIEGEGTMNKMKGSVSLASTIKNAEDVSATFSHKYNPGKIASSAVAMHNGKSYGYNLDMDHSMNGWKVNTKGDLLLTMPKSKVSTNWLHRNDENMVKSQISSKWGKEKLNILLSGSHDLSSTRNINGDLKIDSPWKSLGDVVVSLNHKHGNGLIKSKASVVKDGSTKALSEIKYSHRGKNMNLDFTITPPLLEDISGKLNAKYDTYPMITTGEFQWHPRQKVTAETSINAERWDNAALDLKVTTPVRGYRNINLKASNRKEGGEMVSHANLDYGARKSIDFETRHALEGQNKMARLRISTPFDQVKSLDTGLRFDGRRTNFDSSADFELVPLVGKFQGSAKLNYDKDLTGTLRLDTPYPNYPYFEVSASSNEKGRVRKSRVEARLHPRQVYSADATYSFDLPISVEANINSPYPEYDNLGLVFQHSHSPSSVASHGELRYQPDKKIEGDVNVDWSSNIEGSVLLKTPFPHYETSKVALRHQGDMGDFSTHGEVHVGEKSVVADADFKAGHTTTGTFTLSSPITGIENVELSLKKKGRAKNFRGEMTLTVNGEKIDADYNHRFTKEGLKSAFKLTTPFTENLRLSLEHNGKAQKFTNEISANYGRKYDVDTVVSFEYNHPDVLGHSLIKYKLGGRRNTARVHLNKNGALNDMSFSGSAGLNDDEINVSGSWKNRGTVEGTIKMNTPFKGFKTTGLTVSHDGHLNDFRSSLDVTYMDNKNINGKIALATQCLRAIRLDSEIATPFKKFPSASFIFSQNYDDYRGILNGDISLTTPAARFGSGSFTYMKTGSLDNLAIVTSAKRNGREVGSFKLAHAMTGQEVHSSVQAEVSEYPALAANFDHIGDFSNFNTIASGSLGRDSVSGEIYRRGPVEDLTVGGAARYNDDTVTVTGTWSSLRGLDGKVEVKTPFEGFNDVGMSFSHIGDASDFSSSAKVEFMDNKEISAKIDVNTDGKFVSELSTPFEGFEYSKIEATGAFDSHSGDMNSKVTLMTRVNDFGTGEATFSKYGNMDNLVVDGSILRNNVELGSVKLTNSLTSDELHTAFNGKISEFPEVSLIIDHNGDMSSFNTKAHASLGDMNVIEGETTFNQMGSKVTIASGIFGRGNVSGEIFTRGSMEDLTVGGAARYNTDEVTITGTWKNQRGLDGKLEVKTPFEGFNDVGMSFSHSGGASDFSSFAKVEFMDNKEISAKIDVNTDGKFVSELSTPFEGFEYSKIEATGAFDSHSGDMNSKVTLMTRVNDFGTGEATFSKYGNINNLVVDGSILRNNVELGSVKLTNSLTSDELHTAFNGKISEFPEVSLIIDHNGDMSSFNTKAHASLGDMNVIEGETTFNQIGSKVIADANVMYKTEEYGSNQGALSLTKEGEIDDFTVRLTGKLNDQDAIISGEMKMKDEITGSLTINTPMKRYSNVGASFKHMGNPSRFNTEAQINLIDGEQYSGKINFYRNNYRLIETNVEVYTPIKNAEFTKFEYRHEGRRDNFKCNAALEYGKSKKITYDMSASTSPNVDFSIAIKTPFENYENMMASTTVETTWPQLSITGNINAGNGNLVTLRGFLDASKDINGNIYLSTPVEGFSDVGLSFEHAGKLRNFKSEGRITYMDGKEISGKAVFKQRRSFALAELKTPFTGFEYTRYEWSKKDTDAESITQTNLVYGNGKVTTTETVITFKPRPGFSITIKSPMEDYEEMMASASYDNSWPKLEVNSKAQIGRETRFSFDAAFDATNDISGSVAVKTPVDGFNNIGMSFSHSENSQKFDCEGKVTYMDGKDINGKVSFYKYMWRRLAATAELSTPFRGARSTKAEINYEDNSNSISATAALEYGRRQKIDGNLKLTYSPSYDAILTINTPFYDYKTIRAQGSLDITAPSYSAGYTVNCGYNTVYSASGKLNLYSVDNMDGSLEVVLPIQGIEYTKADYQHKFDSGRADGSVSLTYGNSKTISGEVKASMAPNYDVTVIIKTPFEGYETVQGSANYDSGYNTYGTSSSLSLGSSYTFSVVSSLDLSTEPYRASTQINTPFENYRNMELVITHEGSIGDFRCTGFLSTPITSNINAAVNMKYNNLMDMEGSTSIKSSFEGLDDLMAEIKTSDTSGEKKAHAALGWTSGKQISADSLFREQESWYGNKVYGEMNLATPFDIVRNLAVQAEHSGKQEEINQMFSLELNGEKLLDVDTEYSSKNKHQGSVTFRKPLPMQYTMSASSNAGITEAELLANWNRDEMNSNVHITASMNDQSDSYKMEHNVDVALEYASRKIGIVHKLSSSEPQTSSFGKLYWNSDENSRIFYDMQLSDNSRRRKEVKEGHFNVGLPYRTLGLSGSYSDNRVVKSGYATFSWDSDHDDRQIGLKGTITRGDRLKGDITLSMPAIRKEFRLDGELMSQNGRIILDARTDISYSKDSRKTLTLVSKLEDISDYYSHYNYSLAVGVSHPYTNFDIQMTSHLGCSDEKTTFGVTTDYMTARRNNKNLGLLAEINKLKRQLSLQITNPSTKVEIAGGVVSTSPYTVNMLNKIDDVEMFRSDITLDEDKKSIEINMFEGSESLKLSAGYPNLKEFRGEISRMSYGRETTEALLAVRLNTTRLMHTRLHWDTNMAEGVWQAVEKRAQSETIKAAQVLSQLNSDFADELAGKYSDITSALNEELKPLVDELEKEMKLVAREMNKLSREMRNAYENNAFYVQDMGPAVTKAYKKTQDQLASLTREYREASTQITQSLHQGLQEMTSFPIKEHYSEMVKSATTWLNEKVYNALSSLESCLAKADAALTEYHNTITELRDNAKNSMYNATYMSYISDSLNSIDVSSYMPSLEIPEDYTRAIYKVHNTINTRVSDVLDAPGLLYMKGGLNEIYQQGIWAYNFWQVEENIQAHAQRVLTLIREIVEDELKEYVEDLQGLYQNPITVWQPDNGEVQAEFRLPMDVSRLDEMPDLTPLMNQISANMPDTSALKNISKTLSDLWDATEEDDEISKQLQKYKPSKKLRKAKKGRKYRVRRPRN